MNRKRKNSTEAGRGRRTGPPIDAEGRQRVVIDAVRPMVDGGRFAIKRVQGERVIVEADIFADGHDELSALLLYRRGGLESWLELPMQPSVNDVWRAEFQVTELGDYYYTVQAWVDRFKSWGQGHSTKTPA